MKLRRPCFGTDSYQNQLETFFEGVHFLEQCKSVSAMIELTQFREVSKVVLSNFNYAMCTVARVLGVEHV